MDLPAYVLLGYWIVLQVLGGLPALAGVGGGGGVAFWAHIGGFVAGIVLVKPFERRARVAAHASPHWRPPRVGF